MNSEAHGQGRILQDAAAWVTACDIGAVRNKRFTIAESMRRQFGKITEISLLDAKLKLCGYSNFVNSYSLAISEKLSVAK